MTANLTAETMILRAFAAQHPAGCWDMFGRGWGNVHPVEATTRDALVALGYDAFNANLLMEEALFCATQRTEVTIGAHRTPNTFWQDGLSTATDAVNREIVNAAYAG